jgi:hypothetical protein
MPVSSKDVDLLIDEFSFAGDSSSADLGWTIDKLEDTGLGEDAKSFVAGLADVSLSHAGYFAAGGDSLDAELRERLGSGSANVALVIDTTAYVLPATNAETYNLSAQTGGLITMDASWTQRASAIAVGRRVFAGTVAATGGQASVDLAAIGASGGNAYLFVSAITGTASNANVAVESSANDSTWASEGSFTFSSTGGYAIALSGIVNRYVRINTTSLGGATNITLNAVVCVNNVT